MILKTGNNSVPLELSWFYLISPGGASQQWVEITDISSRGIISVRGLDNTIADWSLPSWHFDDIVVGYLEGGMFLITEDGQYGLITEQGDNTLGQ